MTQPQIQATKIIFACDESGSKSYADKSEKFDGEVGVFAGILIDPSIQQRAESDFQEIFDRYSECNGKLHMADLEQETQKKLRNSVFNTIRKHLIPCFWYAIHVAGFHESHKWFNQHMSDANKTRNSSVRQSNNPIKPESLHVALFDGLYSHLIAFCEERGKHLLDIEVRLDTVDDSIRKQFTGAAESLLRIETEPKIAKGFDLDKRKLVRRKITTEVVIPPEYEIETKVNDLSICCVRDDGLVTAADVLANSLLYIFHKREGDELYTPLNCPSAVRKHELADHLDTFFNWGSGDIIGDRLYAHPKADISGT